MQRDDQTANADMLVYSESRNLREGFGVNNHFRRVSTQSTRNLSSQGLLFKELKGSFSLLLFAFPHGLKTC